MALQREALVAMVVCQLQCWRRHRSCVIVLCFRCWDVHQGSTPQSDEGKVEFAQSCFASWPCAERRRLNFKSCPENWTQDGESCVAPKSYRGMCASATDFRAEWSTMCQAPWPAQVRDYVEWLSNERCFYRWWCASITMSAETCPVSL